MNIIKKIRIPAIILSLLFCFTIFASGDFYNGIGVTAIAEGTVQSEMDSAADGAVVALTGDCDESLTIASGKSVILDLRGHDLTAKIINRGTLTLKDTAGGGAVRITSATAGDFPAIDNFGSLTVDGGNVYTTGTADITANAIVNENGGSLEIKSGEVIATSLGGNFGFGINNLAGATVTEISGGVITSRLDNTAKGSNAVGINNSGTIKNISGGSINGMANTTGFAAAIRLNNGGKIEKITGGRIYAHHAGTDGNNLAKGIYVLGGSTVSSIEGGDIYALVDNKELASKAFGIEIEANGTVTEISGGRIVAKNAAKEWAFGIWNKGNLGTVAGGEIAAEIENTTLAPNAIAIANTNKIGAVTGGTLYSSSTNPNGNTIGIRNQGANAEVKAISGGAIYVSKNNDNHCIYQENGGTATYASGYALGVRSSKTGYRYVLGAGERAEESEDDALGIFVGKVYGSDGSLVNRYRLYGTAVKPAATVGDTEYATVEAAIAAAESGDKVVLGKDLTLDTVEIPEDKNITLDICGTRLSASIVNKGALELIDSASTGKIEKNVSEDGYLVDNFGTLVYDGVNSAIYGSDVANVSGIANEEGATLEYEGGKLRVLAYGSGSAFGIMSSGDVCTVAGGAVEAVTFSTDSDATAIAVAAMGEDVTVSVSGGTLYAQGTGECGGAATIMTEGGSLDISGGALRAVIGSTEDGDSTAYGAYIGEGAAATVRGGEIIVRSYGIAAYGIFSGGNLELSGGIVSVTSASAETVYGVYSEGTSSVTGGLVRATASTATVYAAQGNDSVSGGIFMLEAAHGTWVDNEAGNAPFADGVSLVAQSYPGVRYAAGADDVIAEQLDGDKWIGGDVYRSGNHLYGKHEYAKEGESLIGFTVKGENDMVIDKDELHTLTESSVLKAVYGKVPLYYFVGSSVTYGHTNNGSSFVNEVSNAFPCVCVKEAVSGTTLADTKSDSYVARMRANLDRHANVSHLVVQLSTNDVSRNVSRGTISATKNIEDIDSSTTIGAMEYIIAYAYKTWNCKVVFYTNPYYGNTAYESLIRELYSLREKWGIDIIDFYNYEDMEPLDDATLSSYMSDAIHPNGLGYKWMGEIFTEYFIGAQSRQ